MLMSYIAPLLSFTFMSLGVLCLLASGLSIFVITMCFVYKKLIRYKINIDEIERYWNEELIHLCVLLLISVMFVAVGLLLK